MSETETEKGGGLQLRIAPLEGIAKALRVTISGRSDRASNKRLQETVDGLVETGTTRLLLDCERLEYLNSTALGYLINLVDRVERLQKVLGALPEAQPVLLIRGILRRLGSPRELLGQFQAGELSEMCAAYRLPRQGTPAQLVERLLAYVQRSTTVSLSEILHAGQEIAPLDFAMLPVELTAENVRRVLENCALPKRIPGERAVRDVIYRRLAKVFVHEKVRRRQAVGPLGLGEVDIELAAAFGVEVRLAAGLLGSGRDLQRLLGRLAIAARHYPKGHAFAAIAGAVASSKDAGLGEVRALVEGAGATWVPLTGGAAHPA